MLREFEHITKRRVSIKNNNNQLQSKFSLTWVKDFTIVTLPLTNTVILEETYCGTITKPGFPVVKLGIMFYY